MRHGTARNYTALTDATAGSGGEPPWDSVESETVGGRHDAPNCDAGKRRWLSDLYSYGIHHGPYYEFQET